MPSPSPPATSVGAEREPTLPGERGVCELDSRQRGELGGDPAQLHDGRRVEGGGVVAGGYLDADLVSPGIQLAQDGDRLVQVVAK